jgi:hypothetical protein
MYEQMDPEMNSKDKKVTDTLTKWIPRISLVVGLCAFIFQITVLYPWHLELSQEFAKLAKNCSK